MARTSGTSQARTLELENGVVVEVLRTRPPLEGSRGLASVQLWLATGTCDEAEGQHGAAHMLEHMVFRPWGPKPGQDLANELEARGGEVNAYTSHDETVFHATLPSRGAVFALRALARGVLGRRFDASDYEREREVVIEEIHQYADDAAAVVGDNLLEQLYGSDGYGRPILGTAESLRAMSVEGLSAFYRRHYVGRRLRVIVVGTVSAARIFEVCRELFGKLRAGRSRRRQRKWPAPERASLRLPRVPGTDAPIRLAWAGPSIRARDSVALDLLSVCLGQGESSRLSVALRYRRSLALDVHASYLVGARGGSFSLAATATPEQIESCVAGMHQQVAQLRADAPSDAELSRARAMLRSSLVYRKETVQGQAQAMGYYLTVGGDSQLEERYFEALDQLTRQDLERVANTYLDPARAQLCVGLPRDGLEPKELSALRRRLARVLDPERRGAPSRPTRRVWKRGGRNLWSHDFASGLRLRIHHDDSLPLAAGWIAWPGGQRLESEKRAGQGSLMASCLGRAAPGRAPLEVGRWLDGHAALLDGFFGRSSLGVALESTSDCFSELLELGLDCCLESAFDGGELERQRETTLEELHAQSEDPGTLALRSALAGLYGRHPQARSLRGDREVVARTEVSALEGLIRAQPWSEAVVAVAGKVDPEAIARRLELRQEAASGASLRERIAALSAPKLRRKRAKRVEIRRPEANQSQLVIAYPGIAQSDPRRLAMDLMCEFLGSQTGPLFYSLREERGLVYHVGAAASSGIDGGHVLVHAAASPGNFDEAMRRIDEILDGFVTRGPEPGGLEQARATLAGYFASLWQRRSRVASLLARAELRGGDAANAYALVEALREVTLEQVRELAREVFDPRSRVISIVRGGSA